MIKTIATNEPTSILVVTGREWTYDDLLPMGETMEKYEIIDGVLYMSPSAHVMRQQAVVTNLLFALKSWVAERDLGEVFTAPADVVAAPGRVVQPDVFFVAAARMDIVDAYVAGAPDLVVEVISPSSIKYDRVTKYRLYESIGVREYWLADPAARTIEVFVLGDDGFEPAGRFADGDMARSTLLDGLTVPLGDVFGSK